MPKTLKYTILAAIALCTGGLLSATYKGDFKLGQNVELTVNLMRALFTSYVDPIDPDALGRGAAAGMVAALDPYTELIHADDMSSFELMTTGKYGGIGSLIRQRGEWVQIAQPYKDSPADRAGLEIGDTFTQIEGRSARGMTTTQVSAALKGEPGTDIHIKVRKFFTGREQALTIRREVIALPAIPYYGMAADSVGYIHHSDFTDGCAERMRAAVDDLKARGIKALVLDYRGNGGGILQEAVRIVALFVPKGTEVVSMRGRDPSADKVYRTETEPLDVTLPIAVLVDGQTASAAEIVAGALQDLDRATLVGQRSFGKGLVQTPMPMGYNSWLKVTTAKYYMPSGRCIQAIDYSRRGKNSDDDDASETDVAAQKPDSLRQAYHTSKGRVVYGGEGLTPDIAIEPVTNSRFAIITYAKGYIDDFVDQWALANRGREVTPRRFVLTDADYAAFTAFARDKDFGYESATSQTLEALRRTATRERYMNDDIRAAIATIEAALRDDTDTNLALYRDELSRLIAEGIVLRRHYIEGVSEHTLPGDETVQRAIATFR